MNSFEEGEQQNLQQVQFTDQVLFVSLAVDRQGCVINEQREILKGLVEEQQQYTQRNMQLPQKPRQLGVNNVNQQSKSVLKAPTPNLMQLSIPTCATTNPTQSQQQLTLKQLDCKYSQSKYQSKQPTHSNLQALKNLPRKITKNSHIKIQCKTQFPLVRAVALGQFGWTLMSKQTHKQMVDVIWTDTYVTEELVNRLRPYQKVNHFPYSTQMGRKDYLFANLNKMRAKHKDEYDYFAKTWIFPEDYQRFKEETQLLQASTQNEKKFYIAKPAASCQGKGIFLAKRQDILNHSSQTKLLVQQYIHNTLLIDGLKFDTRIYVLVKSLQPLSIYIYKQGLTRLATTPYQPPNQSNYRNGRMHLTNYAINKSNPTFIHNKDFRKDNIGHKRSLGSLFGEMEKMGADISIVKDKISSIIVKTLLAVYEKMTYLQRIQHRMPAVRESIKNLSIVDTNEDGLFVRQAKPTKPIHSPTIEYCMTKPQTSSKCFQLLGFDIMFTSNFQPKLIQINHQPSLTASSPLDYIIKKCLVLDVFGVLNIDSKQKQAYLNSQREPDPQNSIRGFELKGAKKDITTTGWPTVAAENKQLQLGGFSCIYPVENPELMSLYHKLMPMLLIHEQPQHIRSKRRQPSFSFQKSSPTQTVHTFRQTKTTINKKRQQYTCNYINMLGSGLVGKQDILQKESQDGNIRKPIMEESNKAEENGKHSEKEKDTSSGKKTVEGARDTYGLIKITPRINMSKLAQYEMPKKNLNFTIKHMRINNKSILKQTQSPDNDLTGSDPVAQIPYQTSAKTQTPYLSPRISITRPSNTLGARIQLTNDHSNNMMKQVMNTEPRHSSHDTRIGIRLIKQKNESIGKIEIMTQSIGTPIQITRKHQTISLQKYSSPTYQNNLNSFTTSPHNTISAQTHQSTKPQSRLMRRNVEYFDRVYEKELIQRLNKMKTMKDKLEKLKRNANKSEDEFIATREQFRVNKVNSSHKNITQLIQGPQNTPTKTPNYHLKPKAHSISTIQPQTSLQFQPQKHLPFQTIKLIQFSQPEIKKINHNHVEKQPQTKEKVNSSIQMFKDEAFFNWHKKQTGPGWPG